MAAVITATMPSPVVNSPGLNDNPLIYYNFIHTNPTRVNQRPKKRTQTPPIFSEVPHNKQPKIRLVWLERIYYNSPFGRSNVLFFNYN